MFICNLFFNCEAWNPALESSVSPSSTLQASCFAAPEAIIACGGGCWGILSLSYASLAAGV